MKNNFLGTLLEGAVAVCVVFSAFMCIRLINHSRDLRMYNVQIQQINARNLLFQSLVRDCVDYSRQNPAIDPILATIHVNPGAPARGAR